MAKDLLYGRDRNPSPRKLDGSRVSEDMQMAQLLWDTYLHCSLSKSLKNGCPVKSKKVPSELWPKDYQSSKFSYHIRWERDCSFALSPPFQSR